MTFAIPALVLAGDADAVLSSTGRRSLQGPGIAHVDHTLDGCRSWALTATGDHRAYRRLTESRASLLARGDVLFWLVLTLAGANALIETRPEEAASLLAEAAGPIKELGLHGLKPWLGDSSGRLSTG